MTTFKERLAAAKLPERQVRICLNGDLQARFDELEHELKKRVGIDQQRPARMGDEVGTADLAAELNDIRERMEEATQTFLVRALPRAKWAEKRRQHPPGDDEGDRSLGVALEPFMAEVMPLCIVDPEMDEADWEQLQDVLPGGEFDKLFSAVWDVNRSSVDVPFSRLASLVTRSSGGEQNSPEPSDAPARL